MPSTAFHPSLPNEPQSILEGISKWETAMLESFANHVNELVARRKAPYLSKQESVLVQKINNALSVSVLQKYQALQLMQKTTGVTTREQEELDSLITLIEQKEVERLANMIRLSRIRKVSLDQLREQLGIKTPPPNVW